MKYLFLITLSSLAFASTAKTPVCIHSESALAKYEQQLLEASAKYAGKNHKKFVLSIVAPLNCVLDIQEKAEGFLKYLANSFLTPLLGGGQIAGVPLDKRYVMFADEMRKMSERAKNPLTVSLPAAHARGAWGFYQGFCDLSHQDYCADFLPGEEMIEKQGALLGSSSMLLLRQAYYSLEGKNRDQVANRIKSLYLNIPRNAKLKRQVIDQIYRELFPQPSVTPLGLLS